ncbi:hypothetical protein Efla_003995 [Eimeria flavescens]
MNSRLHGHRAIDHCPRQGFKGGSQTPHEMQFHRESEEHSAVFVDSFAVDISKHMQRSGQRGTAGEGYGFEADNEAYAVAEQHGLAVVRREAPLLSAAQLDRHSTAEGFPSAREEPSKQLSLPYGAACEGAQAKGYPHAFDQRAAQNSFSPYVNVDLEKEFTEHTEDISKGGEDNLNRQEPPHRLSSHRQQKLGANYQPDAPQLAEEAFARIKIWRELDRRAPSYFLTALLSFCLGIVVTVSIFSPIRGFEVVTENKLLRRICVTELLLLFVQTPVAIMVALRVMKLHSLLREPGVLVPLQALETAADRSSQPAGKQQNSEAAATSGLASQAPLNLLSRKCPTGVSNSRALSFEYAGPNQ